MVLLDSTFNLIEVPTVNLTFCPTEPLATALVQESPSSTLTLILSAFSVLLILCNKQNTQHIAHLIFCGTRLYDKNFVDLTSIIQKKSSCENKIEFLVKHLLHRCQGPAVAGFYKELGIPAAFPQLQTERSLSRLYLEKNA